MGPTAEQRAREAHPEAKITEGSDWRFGDDFVRNGGSINATRQADGIGESAQAEWEHGETRPLQTREEIHNAAIRQATNALIEDPGKVWTSGEIVERLFALQYVIGPYRAVSDWVTAEQPSEPVVEMMDVDAGADPGSAESWALVAIQYLHVWPRRDHPVSDALVHRLLRELNRDTEVGR